jgi:peroxiredoxin family protein
VHSGSWFIKKKIKEEGAPPIDEYVQMLFDGGAKLYPCKMSVDMFGLKKEDFVDGVQDVTTASEFIDLSEGAQIVFIERSNPKFSEK